MSPSRVRVSMHYMSVPPLQKAEVTGVGAARAVWLLSNRKTERFDCVVEEECWAVPGGGAVPPRLCLSKTLSGLQRSPATPT
jgi:hypothetical protein